MFAKFAYILLFTGSTLRVCVVYSFTYLQFYGATIYMLAFF